MYIRLLLPLLALVALAAPAQAESLPGTLSNGLLALRGDSIVVSPLDAGLTRYTGFGQDGSQLWSYDLPSHLRDAEITDLTLMAGQVVLQPRAIIDVSGDIYGRGGRFDPTSADLRGGTIAIAGDIVSIAAGSGIRTVSYDPDGNVPGANVGMQASGSIFIATGSLSDGLVVFTPSPALDPTPLPIYYTGEGSTGVIGTMVTFPGNLTYDGFENAVWNATLTLAPVPLPASMALLAPGLLGLLARRRG